MNKDEIQKKVIQITAAETKQLSNGSFQTKLKDQNGLTYNVWHSLKSGGDTQAYSVLKLLPNNGIGSTKEISYKTEEYTNKDGKPVSSRVILGISSTTKQADAPSSSGHSYSKMPEYKDNAEGKVRFGFAIEAFKKDMPFNQVTTDKIEQWTKYVMSEHENKIEVVELNPDEISVDDIGF